MVAQSASEPWIFDQSVSGSVDRADAQQEGRTIGHGTRSLPGKLRVVLVGRDLLGSWTVAAPGPGDFRGSLHEGQLHCVRPPADREQVRLMALPSSLYSIGNPIAGSLQEMDLAFDDRAETKRLYLRIVGVPNCISSPRLAHKSQCPLWKAHRTGAPQSLAAQVGHALSRTYPTCTFLLAWLRQSSPRLPTRYTHPMIATSVSPQSLCCSRQAQE